jgi:hypothetical protein
MTVAVLLPSSAGAMPICTTAQAQLFAWAGSPKTLTLSPPCTGTGTVKYVVKTQGAHGTATAPNAAGTFVFNATGKNPDGTFFIGADQVTFTASDSTPGTVDLPVNIGIDDPPAMSVLLGALGIERDDDLPDGTPAFDMFYRDTLTITATLTDRNVTPFAPLANFAIRFAGLPGSRQVVTGADGKARVQIRPRVSGLITLDVPSLPGSPVRKAQLWIAPTFRISSRRVRGRRLVIKGRLLAERVARTTGTVRLERKKGTRYVTLVRKATLSRATMSFTFRVPKKWRGKSLRLHFIPKSTSTYLGSFVTFRG